MFSDEEFRLYFSQMEKTFYESIILYTDLFHELEDEEVKRKIGALMHRNILSYHSMKYKKTRFQSKESV